MPPPLIPHGTATSEDKEIIQEIHQKIQTKSALKIRSDLFGGQNDGRHRNHVPKRFVQFLITGESQVRNRLTDSFEDDLVIEEHRREKMIEDMIAMTREWKEQSKVANKVMKKASEVRNLLQVS